MPDIKILLLIAIALMDPLSACNSKKKKTGDSNRLSQDSSYLYKVKHSTNTPIINSEWDGEIWGKTEALKLENYMGEMPSHFPPTFVKLQYDAHYIYLIFKVNDQYIRAIETKTHGRVWEDSCVEFFFTPGADTEIGYFNFEANCKGVYLFQYHLTAENQSGFVSSKDCSEISISHSIKKDVSIELTEPQIWSLEYRIPIKILSNYMKVDKPETGTIWRANFYKCGDKTSHPHWLTWAPVHYPKPNFHLPEFFSQIQFE